jgi:hypothetical protein
MTRAKARDGAHWPPCAMNREVAFTTVWLLSSSNTAKTGAIIDSARANCCFSNLLASMRPSASKVRMENVFRTTRTGCLVTSSTTTLAIRARCPAKSGTQWLAGSRNIRSNLVLDSRQRVSSRAIRNVRQEKPMVLPLALTVMLTSLGKIHDVSSRQEICPCALHRAHNHASCRLGRCSAPLGLSCARSTSQSSRRRSRSQSRRRSRLRGTMPRA